MPNRLRNISTLTPSNILVFSTSPPHLTSTGHHRHSQSPILSHQQNIAHAPGIVRAARAAPGTRNLGAVSRPASHRARGRLLSRLRARLHAPHVHPGGDSDCGCGVRHRRLHRHAQLRQRLQARVLLYHGRRHQGNGPCDGHGGHGDARAGRDAE